MSKYMNFEVEDIDILENNQDSQFATAKIRAFHSGNSLNNTYCTEEVLQNTAETIYMKPILYNFENTFGDFGTHVDADKSLIGGFVVPNSATFNKLEDGRMALNVIGKFWKRYFSKALDIIKSDGGSKKVSVEVELLKSKENEDGVLEMVDFSYSGICLLGDIIQEASKGANMQMLSFSKENEDYIAAYNKEFSSKYDGINFKIPQTVKNNAKDGLELHKKYGRGGTSVGLASARYLSSHDTISPEKVRHVAKYFPRHKGDNLDDKTSNGWIAWQLWGGTTAWKWSQNIVDRMNDIDSKSMAYFEEMNFPYKSIKDINPALRGINPPISLSQANEIAKQADAIGTDEKKSGWAIAISQFKKRHVVKNGKWVKKEDFSTEEDIKKKEVTSMREDKEEIKKFEGLEIEIEKEEDETEEEKENMSLNANLDVKAMLAMLGKETEDYKKASEEFAKEDVSFDFEKLCSAMYSMMCDMAEESRKDKEMLKKMAEEATSYMAENEKLRQFKKEVEDKQFEFEIAAALKEVEFEMPASEMAEMKEDVKNYSLSSIDIWKNKVRAKAFLFSKKKQNGDQISVGLPFTTIKNNKEKSLWD